MGNKGSSEKKKGDSTEQKNDGAAGSAEKPESAQELAKQPSKQSAGSAGAASAGAASAGAGSAGPEAAESKKSITKVPTQVQWKGEGSSVQVEGSFNNWEEKITLEKDGDVFSAKISMPVGENLYRFCVDDEWKVDSDLPTKTNDKGDECNVIERDSDA